MILILRLIIIRVNYLNPRVFNGVVSDWFRGGVPLGDLERVNAGNFNSLRSYNV